MTQAPSITSWTRLEPRTRSADMAPGLQARIADPLWLLSRQWQVDEFRGEDTGSPVSVRVRAQSAPLTRYRGEGGTPGPAVDIDRGVPLEALVEREPAELAWDFRHAAELGQEYVRCLREAGAEYAIELAVENYPLTARPGDAVDDTTAGYLTVMAGRCPDGLELWKDLAAHPLPSRIPVVTPYLLQIERATAMWRELAGLPTSAAPADRAWNRERFEYAFAVSARDGVGETVLTAREYDGDRLDWYHLDVRPGDSLDAPSGAVDLTRTVLPAVAAYPGMPAPRWWEMEDARVHWGGIEAEPTDLARMLTAEYAATYGNDYFLVPVDLPVGAITRVTSVVVTDTFGEQLLVPASGPEWNLFRPSVEGRTDAADLLVTLPTVVDSLAGEPVEDVLLLRDEAANLAWAVEHSTTSVTGHSVDLRAGTTASAPPRAPATPDSAPLRYRLHTPEPPHWVPLLPVPDPAHPGRTLLRRLGATARTRILDPGRPMDVPDEEITGSGARVTRRWQLARWLGGSTVLWLGRTRGPGSGEGSSGVRFDVLEHTVRQEDA
ncbi:hypothetical protein, partial [Streptomyces lushanensis]|uniref:hypothetical protein n=1 Tax=Streptomyces lushanensis TaxID=1434255 RepID=UPI0008321C3D